MATFLEVRITARDQATAARAEDRAVQTAVRLAGRFTVFDHRSELCRWRRGDIDDPAPDLAALLVEAIGWQARTDGAFHPATGALTERWSRAEIDGAEPDADELHAIVRQLRRPAVERRGGRLVRVGDTSHLDLNSLAKGYVVDRAAAAAATVAGVERVVVNAGGDLVHRGSGELVVAVEDPQRTTDGSPPLARLRIADAAVATSGRSRRWFEVGGVRHSRVLDPTTGRPVVGALAATVVAPDAATADVLATVAGVWPPERTFELLHELRGEGAGSPYGALVVTDQGPRTDPGWATLLA